MTDTTKDDTLIVVKVKGEKFMEAEEKLKMEKRRDELKEKIQRLNSNISYLNGKKAAYEMFDGDVDSQEEQKKIFLTEVTELEKELKEIEETLETEKSFKSARFLKNFRIYLGKSNVKLGDIEREAGVTAGYVSRLESGKISADPSVEFVLTAAKMLGLSVEQLVNEEYVELSPTEEYISKVLSTMITDTKQDVLVWYTETQMELMCIGADSQGDTEHHLFKATFSSGSSGYPEPSGAEYSSRFARADGAAPAGNFYHTTLPSTKSKIYITKIKEDLFGKINVALEMYMVDEYNHVKPVCADDKCCDHIKNKIGILYKEIEMAASHLRIDDSVRNVFDMYMEELPFN